MLAARRPGGEGLFAQVAPRRELQERFDARARERDDVLARKPAIGRRAGRRGDEPVRQAGEIVGRLQNEEPGLLVGEDVLPELSPQRRQALVDRGEPRLDVVGEAGAGAREGDMIALEHPGLLGVEAERVALRLQGVDPVIKRPVEKDVVAMPGEPRRDLALDRLDFVVAVGRGEIEEDGRHSVERAAARSRASMVFSKVGASGFAATAAISWRASSSAASKAGRKCAGPIAAKGGASNGPVQGSEGDCRSGFGHVASACGHVGGDCGASKTAGARFK